MPKARIDDIEIYYEIHGSGPPVLLVAGLGGEGAYWHPQIAPLSQHFQVIVHDHRGTGQSTASNAKVSVERMAKDLVGLMDALNIERAHLIGHSTGGAIGQVMGIEHSDRLRSLVVYASWVKSDPFMLRLMEARKALALHAGAAAYIRATPLFLYPDWWINAHHESLDAAVAKNVLTFPYPKVMAERIDAILAFDRSSGLGEITTPTLVLCAEDDFLTPPYASRDLAARIPGAKLVIASKGGHAYSQTMPEEFNQIIIDHILDHERQSKKAFA